MGEKLKENSNFGNTLTSLYERIETDDVSFEELQDFIEEAKQLPKYSKIITLAFTADKPSGLPHDGCKSEVLKALRIYCGLAGIRILASIVTESLWGLTESDILPTFRIIVLAIALLWLTTSLMERFRKGWNNYKESSQKLEAISALYQEALAEIDTQVRLQEETQSESETFGGGEIVNPNVAKLENDESK